MGHEDPQVDVNGRHQAALELILAKLDRVHILQLQNKRVHAIVGHVCLPMELDCSS